MRPRPYVDPFGPLGLPRARREDPISSQEAADRIEASGAARAQAEAVLAALRRFPLSTSAELARAAGIDRYAVARRLPELVKAGQVERLEPGQDAAPCAVSGRRACRWQVTP